MDYNLKKLRMSLMNMVINNDYTFIWAHRGASGHVTDNTMDSFKLAIEMGADGIESDVYLTRDGIPIMYHDRHIIVNGRKQRPFYIKWEIIQNINLDKKGRKIPLLKDVLEYFKDVKSKNGNPVTFSLDINGPKVGYKIIDVAKDLDMCDRVELTFDDYLLYKKYRHYNDDIVLVDSAKINAWKKFSGRIFYKNFSKLNKYGIKAVNLKAEDCDDDFIEDITQHGLQVYVWDCHNEENLREFIGKNVHAVYSNYPDLAQRIRDEIQT